MQTKKQPIGVFDSGLGGLTAVKEIQNILPGENIVYFGDTGRLPYGTRSPKTIQKYACDDMNFLLTNSVKAVLVACGTVSSTALEVLKSKFDVPIIGVVEPASKAACSLSKVGRIAVLATPSTIRTKAFDKAIAKISPAFDVLGIGCPMFVPLVENGYTDDNDPITYAIAKEYVSKLADFKPDVIILGCTHYPVIKNIIAKAAQDLIGDVSLVDSGRVSALALKDYLEKAGLATVDTAFGNTSFYVSDQPYNFQFLASRFLGEAVSTVNQIRIEDYMYTN